jgi:protein kinase-like protein/WD40 repeat protein
MALSAGTHLGPYEILAPIGAGGMGEVYRAHDPRMGRDVAIKVSAERFSDRFSREVRAIAALNHPNICTLYDVGPNYLVMELVEGPTLAERIKESAIPLDEALGIAGQIADALEVAHEKGITHRDLKPGNVKIKAGGAVKVLDFGLAKQSRDRDGAVTENSPTLSMAATEAGVILGTAPYMSPEQARGKPVDKRTDIWAFGVVLYEMLTGKRPFRGEDVAETLAAVITKEPNWERVPVKVRRLLKRCLEKDPQKRLRDITGVGLLLEDEPQGAAPRHTRVPWAAAAALALIAAIGLFVAWRATRPVAHPLMNLSVDLGPDAVLQGRVTVILSPDGTRLVYRSRGGLSTRLLDQSKSTLLAGTEGAADPFFSPDGQWVGFFADGKVKKISVQGGAAVTLCDAPSAHGGSWGEGGSIVFAPIPQSGLLRVSEAGGTPQPLTQLDQQKGETTHRFPQILPGGNSVLFTASSGTAEFNEANLGVLSLKTGQRKTLQRGGYFGRYLPSGHLVYMQRGTLFAAPMDLDKLALTGPALPLLEDVATNAIEGTARFDISGVPSGSGSFVYVSGSAATTGRSIAWLDSTGKTQPLKATPGAYSTPSLSPDGKRLAFSQNFNDITVYDWQRDTTSRLTFTPGTNNYPVWTPDGRGIVYRSAPGAVGNLYWVRSDGAAAALRLTESKNDQTPYSFSPDGKRLAFVEQGGATLNDIWTLPIDWSDPEHPKAGQPEVFLRTPNSENAPAFSPDGRWLAYGAQEGPNQEVYVRPFPADPSGGKWQISNGGGNLPIWSRGALGAGRELFYQSPNGIMVVRYTAKGATFVPDKPRLWSDYRIYNARVAKNYDLAPDGKRFAVFELPEGEQKPETHVTLLLNFFDEVRRRVPPGK